MNEEHEQPEKSQEIQEKMSEHPAITELKKLNESGIITRDIFDNLYFKFQKLNEAFVQSCSSEKVLQRRANELNRELKAQKLTIENSATEQQEHRSTLSSYRQRVTSVQVDLDSTVEQITTTRANTQVKKKEKEKLADKVAKARDDQQLKLEPQKRQIQIEIKNLEEAISQRKETINKLSSNIKDISQRIAKDDEQLAEIDKKKKNAAQKMLEIGSIPIKTRQKSTAVEASHNALLNDEKLQNAAIAQADSDLQQFQARSHDLDIQYQQLTNNIEGLSEATRELKTRADELRQQSIDILNTKQQRDYEAKTISKEVFELTKTLASLNTKTETIGKDIEKKEKENLRLQESIARLNLDKNSLTSQINTMKEDETQEMNNNAKLHESLVLTQKAQAEALKAFLSQQSVNEETVAKVKAALAETQKKQIVHDELVNTEHDLTQQLSEASLIRDRKAREMALMKKKTVDAKALAMEKNLDYLDLCHKQESIMIKMRDYAQLYENVKMERNRYVNTIQTSRQLIVELKEKIRILENEIEVLRNEFTQVEAAVKLQKNKLTEVYKRRDGTRSDLKQKEMFYRELQSKIDFQSNETDRMNHTLQNIEDQINHQQERCSIQADDVADRRRMLIDKQDAFCILLEQFNRHEEVMKQGEKALCEREEDVRLLSTQLKAFEREIDILLKKRPQLKAYQKEIKELDYQLEKERKEVITVTKELEVPNLKKRLRSYCGKDFTLKELTDKVSLYEQRINSKEQQLWEKKILLREIEEKIGTMSAQLGKESDYSHQALEKAGNIRAESRGINRRTKAALSEMAIYQAQSQEYEEQKKYYQNELKLATERASRGESFDEVAERSIKLHLLDQQKAKTSTLIDYDEEEENPHPGRQHFDAYPTADGLSRPYGAFPVFQPAAPSGQLRYYHKETERVIEM